MGTYVMSDIHGCYDEMLNMHEKIDFSSSDKLIMAGDYIDRGLQSYEMLMWIENCPQNVILLRGNHEEEFAYDINLMNMLLKQNNIDCKSIEDTEFLHEILKQLSLQKGKEISFFDYYGTIGDLIKKNSVSFEQLDKWSKCIGNMPFFYKNNINGRNCVIVHAGYTENFEDIKDKTEKHFLSLNDFYLYARDDAYIYGGVKHGLIVAGHTPTTLEEELPFNDGYVYKFYDKNLDCIFYDIDCGCSSRGRRKNGKLACLRLEDESIFYV